jgi:hypothetical protein
MDPFVAYSTNKQRAKLAMQIDSTVTSIQHGTHQHANMDAPLSWTCHN